MKILVVHEVDYINKPFFEFQEFAEGLSARGHLVTVLHVREFEKNFHCKSRAFVEGQGFEVPQSKVTLCSPFFVVKGYFTRFLAIFDHFRLLLKIFLSDTPDIVLSYSVPTSGVTAAVFGKFFDVPVVHRSIDVSHLLRSKTLSPLVKISEVLVFWLSDAISTHNGAMESYIRKSAGPKKEISIDYPPVYPIEMPKKTLQPKIKNELRIIFIGTLAHFTDLEEIFVSMAKKSHLGEVKLRIVGIGPKESELKRLSKGLGLEDKIEFRGWKSRQEFGEELTWANVGIIPFKQNQLTNCALPQKALEYLSAGLSVVSSRLEGSESVLGDFDNIHFTDSSAEIFELCEKLALSGKLQKVDSGLIAERFGRESALRNMEKMLMKVQGAN